LRIWRFFQIEAGAKVSACRRKSSYRIYQSGAHVRLCFLLIWLNWSLIFCGSEHRADTGEPLPYSSTQLTKRASSRKLVSPQLACSNGCLPCSSDRCLLRATLHDGVSGSQTFSQVGAPHIASNPSRGLRGRSTGNGRSSATSALDILQFPRLRPFKEGGDHAANRSQHRKNASAYTCCVVVFVLQIEFHAHGGVFEFLGHFILLLGH
jgi:hypothetical protein